MSQSSSDRLLDDYSQKFNSLSDKLEKAGIDVKELIKLISAYDRLPIKIKHNN